MILETEEGREKERARNINAREKYRSVASCMCPDWGLNLQPRHVPWPGIEPVTLWFAGWHPANWATLARARASHICICLLPLTGMLFLKLFTQLALPPPPSVGSHYSTPKSPSLTTLSRAIPLVFFRKLTGMTRIVLSSYCSFVYQPLPQEYKL